MWQRSGHGARVWIVASVVLALYAFALASMKALGLVVLVAGISYLLYRLVRHTLKERYFASEEFLAHKAEIYSVVAEHNDIARYVAEIQSQGTYELGGSSAGVQAHLATFDNTSRHQYRRDRNLATYQDPKVHNCSLQVVRNASGDPIKYLMKYFDIKANEEHLAEVERLGDEITRLEDAVANLQRREDDVTLVFSPPKFILNHYVDEFMEHVGIELSPISVPYPVYTFEYVSAGGNSGQRSSVTLDRQTIDALIETMSQKIKWRKTAAGQRALMTTKLRAMIKDRDNHTCRYCSISLVAEPHLLLEVDHIIPVSKGGQTAPENLQTLCWRCNRTKSNKIVAAR